MPDLYWCSPHLFPFLSSFEREEVACTLRGQADSQFTGQACSALPGSCSTRHIVLWQMSLWSCPEGSSQDATALPLSAVALGMQKQKWGERCLPVCLPSSRGQML